MPIKLDSNRMWEEEISSLTNIFNSGDSKFLDESIEQAITKVENDIKFYLSELNLVSKNYTELIIIFLGDLQKSLLNLKDNHTKKHLKLVMEQQKEVLTALYSDKMGDEYEE